MFTLCLIHSSSTFAGSPNQWQKVIDTLLQSGLTRIGNFDVEAFRQKALTISIKPIANAPPSVLSGSRESAYNRCGQDQVYIADQLPSEAISSLAQLELHEILGALCFDDNDYAMSTALVTLAEMRDQSQKERLAKNFAKSVFARNLKLAGATGVSGGGDLVTMFIKNQVLQKIMGDSENRLSATPEFLAKYATINFEPLQSKFPRQVHLRYKYLKNGQESFAVYVPMERWRAGQHARNSLIQEITVKVMQIFPSYSGQGVRTFRPTACGANGPSVTFPIATDSAVAQIQDQRGGLITGCQKFTSGFTSIEIISPALSDEDAPKVAGNYYLNCVITFGKGKMEFTPRIAAGRNTTHSMSADTPAGGQLLGKVAVTATGKIAGIGLDYSINGSQTKMPMQAPLDTLNAKVDTSIEGFPTSFTCSRAR